MLDTLAEVVGPLVEKVPNLEMANESREKSAADFYSLVADLVAKVDKMSVSVSCLAQDTDGFRSDVEQNNTAIRNRTTQRMTALTKDMKEKMEICVGMEDRVLVRIGNDFEEIAARLSDTVERVVEDLLKSTKELA